MKLIMLIIVLAFFTFISTIHTTSESLKVRKVFNFQYFSVLAVEISC